MKFPVLHHHPASDKLNVTPLIDVIMVLIIFYLIVGQLAVKDRSGLTLPATALGTPEPGSGKPIILSILREAAPGTINSGTITLDGAPIADISQLPELLRAADAAARSIQLRADKDLPYSAVAPVIEACRNAGVASIKLITTRGPTP